MNQLDVQSDASRDATPAVRGLVVPGVLGSAPARATARVAATGVEASGALTVSEEPSKRLQQLPATAG